MGKPNKSDYNNIAKSPLERLQQSKRAKANIDVSEFSGGFDFNDYYRELEMRKRAKDRASKKKEHPAVKLLDPERDEYRVEYRFDLPRGTFNGAKISTISIDEIGYWDISNLNTKGSEYDPNIGS